MTIVDGDATSPQAKGPKVIAHVCNNIGGWGKGFVAVLSHRWPQPQREYRVRRRGLAGGRSDLIEPLIVAVFCARDITVSVFDATDQRLGVAGSIPAGARTTS